VLKIMADRASLMRERLVRRLYQRLAVQMAIDLW
jgi:hypothetical protein